MGCGCRGGKSRAPSRSPGLRNKQQTLCSKIERKGNDVAVRIDSLGRIFLAAPLGNGAGLSVTSLLSSLSCKSAFASLLKDSENKTMVVFSSPIKLDKFNKLMPHKTVKLGYLRNVLLEF